MPLPDVGDEIGIFTYWQKNAHGLYVVVDRSAIVKNEDLKVTGSTSPSCGAIECEPKIMSTRRLCSEDVAGEPYDVSCSGSSWSLVIPGADIPESGAENEHCLRVFQHAECANEGDRSESFIPIDSNAEQEKKQRPELTRSLMPKVEIDSFSIDGVIVNPMRLNSEQNITVTGFSYPSYCEIAECRGLLDARILDVTGTKIILRLQVVPHDDDENYFSIVLPRCTLRVAGYILDVRQRIKKGHEVIKLFRIVR